MQFTFTQVSPSLLSQIHEHFHKPLPMQVGEASSLITYSPHLLSSPSLLTFSPHLISPSHLTFPPHFTSYHFTSLHLHPSLHLLTPFHPSPPAVLPGHGDQGTRPQDQTAPLLLPDHGKVRCRCRCRLGVGKYLKTCFFKSNTYSSQIYLT